MSDLKETVKYLRDYARDELGIKHKFNRFDDAATIIELQEQHIAKLEESRQANVEMRDDIIRKQASRITELEAEADEIQNKYNGLRQEYDWLVGRKEVTE